MRLLALLLALFPTLAWAGAWTLPKGSQELYLTGSYYKTDEYFNQSGNETDIPDFSKWELNPYYQYGFMDGLTLGVSAFLQQISQDKSFSGGEDSNWGLGNTEVFARWRAYRNNNWVVSLQPLLALPTYYAEDDPRAGRDDFDTELKGLVGYNFEAMGRHHFIDGGFGYRYRLGDEGNQWKANVTLGITLDERWTILPEIDITRATDEDSNNAVSVAGTNDYDLTKLQLSGAYKWDDHYTFQLGAFNHVDGKNTGSGGGVLFSVWMRY
ncbi:MAG: hypothetical protein U1E36_05025 [Rickettsiales bacterium]